MEIRDAPKLLRVSRIDSIPAGSTYFNEQGFLHDTPVVTSIGIFEYSMPDGGVRRELRLPEHVFNRESLSSYVGRPVIITHEAGEIDKDNVMDEIVGTILSEGYQDGDNVRCKVVIHAIDKVKNTPYRELSLGYNLDLIEESGVWNGELYDAIQTNIRINHLAIVDSARAGNQAHLNLDGKKVITDNDKKTETGGTNSMNGQKVHNDSKGSIDMTPEELVEAIKNYKATHSGNVEPATDKDAQPEESGEDQVEEPLSEPSDINEEADNQIKSTEKKDSDVQSLISAVKQLLASLEGGNTDTANDKVEGCFTEKEDSNENEDDSKDMSKSMNADSADKLFQQRLSICRIGDKLRMDGLENKSIADGKKAIIAKVLPSMRLDGKNQTYVDAAYDIAVSEVNKRRDVSYQKKQMMGNGQQRADGATNSSMALSARQRMIEREGGEE